MKATEKYQGIKYQGEKAHPVEDIIAVEVPLKISINGVPFTVTMCSPGDQEDLVNGLLHAEDIIKDFEEMQMTSYKGKDGILEMQVSIPETDLKEGYMTARNFLSLSSCGVCGKTTLPEVNGKLSTNPSFDVELIREGYLKMKDEQGIFNASGGCHAAGILDQSGQLLVVREDIGRHNAVDKAVGSLLRSRQLSQAQTLLVSGRISYEIIIKTFRAKIPVLVAVSAPSSLAIDYAKELGIVLIGFCRENKMTRYA